MMQQLWKSFPRQFEQKVNGLLDYADPNAIKAFQLYKACQQETLYSSTFEEFSEKLSIYFSKARRDRHKSEIDRFLDRPIDQSSYEEFHLTFRSAAINSREVRDVASWAHHVLRVGGHMDSAASSIKTLNEVLLAVIQPGFYGKEVDIEFSDICERWKNIISTKLGTEITSDVKVLFTKLADLDQQSKSLQNSPGSRITEAEISTVDFYNFTLTELTWIRAVEKKAESFGQMPKYPLSKGPQKIQLIELERIITLYSIIQLTDKGELLQHRKSIRATLLNRCQFLLR